MSPASVLTLFLIALGAAALSPADAQAGGKHDRGQQRGDNGVSLDEVVSNLRRGSQGRVLSADTVDRDGQPVHRIKILTDEGRVKRYQMDSQSGQPIPPGKGERKR
jgi:uncharacterized membrane protein YkoI